jgi:hypothetical protein
MYFCYIVERKYIQSTRHEKLATFVAGAPTQIPLNYTRELKNKTKIIDCYIKTDAENHV